MPLLWKPWRRRKEGKRKQQQVVSSSTSGSASSSIELPPALQEVDDDEDGEASPDIVFAAVIQDFNRSAYDELSVRRGQMIQPLYNDGMWLYVRDIDGHCGYIPANFCSPLDEIKSVHWKTEDPGRASRKVKPRQRSIHDLVRPALHSYSSYHDSCPSTPAANFLQSPPQNNRTANTSLTGSQVSADLFTRQDVISRARERTQPLTTSINSPVPQQILHPLHPLTFTQRREFTSDIQRRPSTEDTDRPLNQHNLHVAKVHGRSSSYQEAAVSGDMNTNCNGFITTPPQIMIHRPSRPSHLPLCRNHHHPYDHLESYRLDTQRTTTEGLPTSSRDSQCPDDDVFLPTANKPQGIFRVLDNYHRNVQGEVTVKKNEYVIVMSLGVGEWAGILTSSGTEGVIPKIILQRYTPHMLCSVSTQTELMIVAPAVFSVGTGSSAADNTQSTQRDVVTIREVSLTYRQRRRRRQSQPRRTTATQANAPPNLSSSSLPRQSHLQPQAWGSNDGQLGNSFWYENSISIPRLPRDDCSSTHSIASINGLNRHPLHSSELNLSNSNATAALLEPSSNDPPPPLHNPPPPPLVLDSDTESLSSMSSVEGPSCNIDHNEVDNGSPQEANQENGELADCLRPLATAFAVEDIRVPDHLCITPHKTQTVTLTAVRRFTPSSARPNSLPLQPGDLLQLSPGKSKVQDGWIWAFHTGLKVHGFVPHSHMAYLYLTPNKRIRNPSSIDEAV